MRWIRLLFGFYINASIHVALAVCALVGVTVFEYGLSVTNTFMGFVFFGSITGYNFVKYAQAAGMRHRSLAPDLKAIQLFSMICFGLMLHFFSRIPRELWYIVALLGLLTVFYAIPFLKKKNLRTFSGMKIFVVAIVWAGVTVIMPWVSIHTHLSNEVWWTFLQRILFVLVLTFPFEIRDLAYDRKVLRTLPQQFGIDKVKVIGVIILVFFIMMESFKLHGDPSHYYSLVAIAIIAGTALLASRKHQSLYYASFWVESIPILWWGMLYLSKELFV